jgi:uncharacterized protein YbjT (DUF2867 family)
MKILLTGATGYIGKRLIPVLIDQGHEVYCCIRDKKRLNFENSYYPKIKIIEVDFLKKINICDFPENIDIAYFLIHSMSSKIKNFGELEEKTAINFVNLAEQLKAKQIIYLGGITNQENLSKHLRSRKRVEEILSKSRIPLTSIKTGIIVGSGSASFEIIRDLVEKLPIMIAPKWLNTKHQPIAIRNVLEYLTGVILRRETFNKSFDVGGPEILTYKDMLLEFAKVRKLKRVIITVPVMTPRLSAYWLYFVTSVSYRLAVNLVESMKVPIVAKDNELEKILNIHPISYKDSVELAFQKIEQNNVISSWKDSLISSNIDNSLLENINVPLNGCYTDIREKEIKGDIQKVFDKLWSIGGDNGWYYANFLWEIRGIIDKIFGGVGLRRGRKNQNEINTGESLDFWRVLVADKINRRLLLYAEMKLPGEAWLEFKIVKKNQKFFLVQTATFRPKGLTGRLYWYLVLPFHFFVFEGMAKNLVK